MKWSVNPPKEKGWYWVVTNGFTSNKPEIVYVGYPDYDDRLHVYDWGESETIEDYCKRYERMWGDKIEVPNYDWKKDYVKSPYYVEGFHRNGYGL